MIVKHRYFHFYLSIILWSWFLWNMFISRQKKSKIFPLVGIMQLGKSDCKKKKFVPVKYGLGYSLHCFFSLFPIICLFFLIIVFHHHCFLRIVNDCRKTEEGINVSSSNAPINETTCVKHLVVCECVLDSVVFTALSLPLVCVCAGLTILWTKTVE